jgi:hypothetical protein
MDNIKKLFKKILSNLHSFPKWLGVVVTICSLIFGIVSTTMLIKDRNFEAKRVGFIDFMDDVLKVEDFAQNKDLNKIKTTFQEMDKLYLGFEAIMDKESYETVLGMVSDYYDMTIKYTSRKEESNYTDLLRFKLYQESYIYPTLFKSLFGKEPSDSLPNWARENLPKDFNPAPGITDLN